MNHSHFSLKIIGFGMVFSLMLVSFNAAALDAYQDRRGGFGGMGIGGGLVLEGSEAGGGGVLDFQFGAGATKNLTVGLDVDVWFQGMAANTKLLVSPGPEVTYFFGETGLYIRPGVAVALAWVWPDEADLDFLAGVDFALGLGWEFFYNASGTMGLEIEGEYVVMPNWDNLATVGVMVTMRRY